ncbi:MAG: ketoacyl-ACP synthase III [Bacteroidota bacterium]
MYIRSIGHYFPSEIVPNSYFTDSFGLSHEWLLERTGIVERRKATSDENTHTLAICAVQALFEKHQINPQEVDLIVGATYTPFDLIVTLGHAIQHQWNIEDIPVVTISSACSSLLNAMEIVEGYFAMGKAKTALVVAAEHNTAYYNPTDTKSNHLWGDGASALYVTQEQQTDSSLKIIDLKTGGAGTVGKAMEGVMLRPNHGGINMPHGRDVFIHACTYMAKATREILAKNHSTVEDVSWFIPHQANRRITRNVARELGLSEERIVSNIQYLGNTGSAGCGIGLSEIWDKINPKDLIVMTVFGGGYSWGAMLLEG